MDDQNQTPPQTPPGQPVNSLLTPPTSSEEGTMKMRNVMNGEIKDAVKAGGKDPHGRVRYTPQTGYEPVGMHTVDVDGTWLEIVTPSAAKRGVQVPAMSGANAIVSDEEQSKLNDEAQKVAAARAGTPPSDAVVDQSGKPILTADGQPPHEGEEGKNDLGENIQTGKKRGR